MSSSFFSFLNPSLYKYYNLDLIIYDRVLVNKNILYALESKTWYVFDFEKNLWRKIAARRVRKLHINFVEDVFKRFYDLCQICVAPKEKVRKLDSEYYISVEDLNLETSGSSKSLIVQNGFFEVNQETQKLDFFNKSKVMYHGINVWACSQVYIPSFNLAKESKDSLWFKFLDEVTGGDSQKIHATT